MTDTADSFTYHTIWYEDGVSKVFRVVTNFDGYHEYSIQSEHETWELAVAELTRLNAEELKKAESNGTN